MAETVIIYTSNDSDLAKMGPRRAEELGVRAIGVRGTNELLKALSELRDSRVLIGRLLFYTHGDAGGVSFPDSLVQARHLPSDYVGKGFENLFAPDAEIIFYGCWIAGTKPGCETGKCSVTDNGPVFLTAVAKTFLFKAGGRVTAWKDEGWAYPSLGGSVIHHNAKDAVYVYINRGGTRTRLAAGVQIRSFAGLMWDVGVKSNDEKYLYSFGEQKVTWITHNFLSGSGNWSLEPQYLRIAWDSGGEDRWDVPVFSGYETGVTIFGPARTELPLVAEPTPPQPYIQPRAG
jgi:hypothetical protein